MSTSIITDADLVSTFRTGTKFNSYGAVPPPADAGSGMVITLTGTDGSPSTTNPVAADGGPTSSLLGFSPATYLVGGDVDWNNIANLIPAAARITKVNIISQVDYHVQDDTTVSIVDAVGGPCLVKGSARAALYLRLSCPDTAFVPTTDDFVNASDLQTQVAFATSFSKLASVLNLGLIMETEWDIANDLSQFPLGYITYTELVTNFTRQQYLLGNGSFTNGARSVYQWQVPGGSVGNRTTEESAIYNVNASGWILTVTWEIPFNSSLVPVQIQEGDIVTATSEDPDPIDFSQLLTAALIWTDDAGNPQSISIPSNLWIIFTLHLFKFTVPALTGAPEIVLLSITSTQFSGSITLGHLVTIFFLNATGIYTLTPGKTNDTIYDNNNGGTVDVKIPDPFWKTGFIGG